MAGAGEMLRLEREGRGLLLEDVAAETRIRAEYLDAIEREDYAALPGDVYTRGFLRNYASYLGLDPVAVLAAYEGRLTPKRPRPSSSAPAPRPRPAEPIRIQPLSPTRIDTRVRYAPSIRLMGLIAFVLLIVVYLGYSAYTGADRQSLPTPSPLPAAITAVSSKIAVGAVPAELTLLPTPSPRSLGTQVAAGQVPLSATARAGRGSLTRTPVAGQGLSTQPPVTQTPDLGQIPTQVTGDNRLTPQPPPGGDQFPTFGLGTPIVDAGATMTAGAFPAAGVTVQLSVGSQNAWVLVTTDGKVQFQGTLGARTVRAFTAQNIVRIRFARGDITSVNVNGVDKGLASDSAQTVITKEWDALGNERIITGP